MGGVPLPCTAGISQTGATSFVQELLFWRMDTLENIIQSGQSSGPYPKGTKVLIVETKLQGDILNLGIADVTAATKAVCYNKDIQPKLMTNKTFLIRNFQKGRSCLIFNNKTKVTNAPAINNISENILDIARHLVNPPQPQLVSLKDVKLPKPGTPQKMMTVSGEIFQNHLWCPPWNSSPRDLQKT
ncbi:uncharacterized protein [Apostichopus japonicus]|uniref:uncharacterized protein isoform X1 n=1 Tax=Stichopus japonicus TaxID=307972 RepID=UPI003AB5790B